MGLFSFGVLVCRLWICCVSLLGWCAADTSICCNIGKAIFYFVLLLIDGLLRYVTCFCNMLGLTG